MQTTDAFVGLACLECGATHSDSMSGRCHDCGGILDPAYDYGSIDVDRDALSTRPFDSMWRYESVLPFARERAVTLSEGGTPLIECPALAAEIGVERVLLKDDGRNPSGASVDRGTSLTVTAVRAAGETTVALASAGDSGQSAAAYAARAGVDAHVFLPARSGFTSKAMVNVHDADLTVGGGRFGDALDAYEAALTERDEWIPILPFETPYRHEGQKTILYEVVEQLDWTAPDAVVAPAAHGAGIVGLGKAARELVELGVLPDGPALFAAQASGCAPLVDAWENEREHHEPWSQPDTICGELEIPDPVGSPYVLSVLRESDGGAVATDDADILESGAAIARNEGVSVGPSAAAAVSGAWELGRRGTFDPEDTVVVVGTASANKEPDVLRSHLMGQGV